jgi:hypothetical protein
VRVLASVPDILDAAAEGWFVCRLEFYFCRFCSFARRLYSVCAGMPRETRRTAFLLRAMQAGWCGGILGNSPIQGELIESRISRATIRFVEW